jgi:uncharacterized hydrophobic protein (TIGR00271 family)
MALENDGPAIGSPEEDAPPSGPIERIRAIIPTLDRDGRKELVDRINLGARGGVDFITMMVLSATLATLGLLQGSGAVVIGAMLVAPLVGPLVGAGMALVQANLHLFRSSLWVTTLGLALGLGVSMAITAVSPGFEPSLEIHARGTPDLLDLGIAFASGIVAAYAMGRPNVSGTLAGVAIAAALVPPLAVVGIAITGGQWNLAGNASILLVTNVVSIILGAALVFRVIGVGKGLGEEGSPGWARFSLMFLSLFTVLLIAPLFLTMLEERRAGARRSLVYAVAPRVTDAVRDYLEGIPEAELIVVSRNSPEPSSEITVLVSCDSVLPDSFAQELEEIVVHARGEEVSVRVFTLLSARLRSLSEESAAVAPRKAPRPTEPAGARE